MAYVSEVAQKLRRERAMRQAPVSANVQRFISRKRQRQCGEKVCVSRPAIEWLLKARSVVGGRGGTPEGEPLLPAQRMQQRARPHHTLCIYTRPPQGPLLSVTTPAVRHHIIQTRGVTVWLDCRGGAAEETPAREITASRM
jgi:hypothetical protein